MEESYLESFFGGIESRLPQPRAVVTDDVRDLISGLTPKLEAAWELDRRMNQVFAHRFNVLDYLRTDELGLSLIIADLFNPKGNHGQDTSFLQSFLNKLRSEKNCVVDSRWLELKPDRIKVVREKVIEKGRKVDIYIKMECNSGSYCLAIENKPYAGDQPDQVADYLSHLSKEFGKDRFILIYLAPQGELPSESSLKVSERSHWRGRFMTMAYCNESFYLKPVTDSIDSHSRSDYGNANDGNGNDANIEDPDVVFYSNFSLADWFAEYREKCEVDRLRSFLLDAKNFCEKRFGGQMMVDNSERKVVEDFILQDKSHIRTARIIYESFESIRYKICKAIFDSIVREVRVFTRNKGWENPVILVPDSKQRNREVKHYLIALFRENYGCGPGLEGVTKQDGISIFLRTKTQDSMDRWFMGIRIVNREEGKDFENYQTELIEEIYQEVKPLPSRDWERPLKREWWPLNVDMDDEYNSWYTNLPKLVEAYNEQETKDGLVGYYVESLQNLALRSQPIIDKHLNGLDVSERRQRTNTK